MSKKEYKAKSLVDFYISGKHVEIFDDQMRTVTVDDEHEFYVLQKTGRPNSYHLMILEVGNDLLTQRIKSHVGNDAEFDSLTRSHLLIELKINELLNLARLNVLLDIASTASPAKADGESVVVSRLGYTDIIRFPDNKYKVLHVCNGETDYIQLDSMMDVVDNVVEGWHLRNGSCSRGATSHPSRESNPQFPKSTSNLESHDPLAKKKKKA